MSRQYRYRKSQRPKNRLTAAFIAFFFGMFGAHKFYLNQTGQGFIFLFIFFMTSSMIFPITMLLGVFDAFRLFTMSDEQFHHKYNRGAHVNPTHRDTTIERRKRKQVERTRRDPYRQSNTPSRAVIQRANPFKKSGLKKYKDFDLEGAIEDFSKALEINPQDVAVHFNIANAYSLTEKKEKAYYHLDKAVELGFQDLELLTTKDDLAYVRIQPEWDDFKENGFRLKRGMLKSDAAQQNTKALPTDDVLLSQLNKLAELRKKGLLSEEEFAIERKKLLARN